MKQISSAIILVTALAVIALAIAHYAPRLSNVAKGIQAHTTQIDAIDAVNSELESQTLKY